MNNAPTKAKKGYFGDFGGQFVPETLMAALNKLEQAYEKFKSDADAQKELNNLLRDFVGRPTPLFFAKNLSRRVGARIFLKREDLAHTGAHKINNALGQALLAKYMGKKRIIAETGAGQHGVASATTAALLGLKCRVYMGKVDIERQRSNVFRMQLLGAEVVPVLTGSQTLKDAINEAIRDWIANMHDTHYLLGSALGPHPYPSMVRDFQTVIGKEARRQILEHTGKLPDYLVACVGGGSNSIGLFYQFLEDSAVQMIGVEAGGTGIKSGKHAARFAGGRLGILHGSKTYVLQDRHGQISDTHSVSAGLDYAAIGPEHVRLREVKRTEYSSVTDTQALAGFKILCETEGIIPALESSHAIAYVVYNKKRFKDKTVVINLSGRGDKDLDTAIAHLK